MHRSFNHVPLSMASAGPVSSLSVDEMDEPCLCLPWCGCYVVKISTEVVARHVLKLASLSDCQTALSPVFFFLDMVKNSDMLDDLDELSVINDLARVLPDEYFIVSRYVIATVFRA